MKLAILSLPMILMQSAAVAGPIEVVEDASGLVAISVTGDADGDIAAASVTGDADAAIALSVAGESCSGLPLAASVQCCWRGGIGGVICRSNTTGAEIADGPCPIGTVVLNFVGTEYGCEGECSRSLVVLSLGILADADACDSCSRNVIVVSGSVGGDNNSCSPALLAQVLS